MDLTGSWRDDYPGVSRSCRHRARTDRSFRDGGPRRTASHGRHRLLVAGERCDDVDRIMTSLGIEPCTVLPTPPTTRRNHWRAAASIICLGAGRTAVPCSLEQKPRSSLRTHVTVKVVEAEDLIGLKSNPPRTTRSGAARLADIQRLLENQPGLDLDRVREVFSGFSSVSPSSIRCWLGSSDEPRRPARLPDEGLGSERIANLAASEASVRVWERDHPWSLDDFLEILAVLPGDLRALPCPRGCGRG